MGQKQGAKVRQSMAKHGKARGMSKTKSRQKHSKEWQSTATHGKARQRRGQKQGKSTAKHGKAQGKSTAKHGAKAWQMHGKSTANHGKAWQKRHWLLSERGIGYVTSANNDVNEAFTLMMKLYFFLLTVDFLSSHDPASPLPHFYI
jgi:hypothetical protein